jgi:hypothetical protein
MDIVDQNPDASALSLLHTELISFGPLPPSGIPHGAALRNADEMSFSNGIQVFQRHFACVS